jgi:TusA-related sulfurtransferase
MLEEFEAEENQQIVVLADCYYACTQIMNYCREREYSFVSVLKSNRVFIANKRKTTVRKYTKRNFRTKKNKITIRIKENKYRTITRKVSLKTGGVVKVVFSKHQSHRTVLAVFTTNTTLPAKRILEFYQNRWDIEVFFKMSKQNLGLKAYQNRNLNAIKTYLRISLCAHNLLTHVFINDLREKGKRLTKKNIAHFSVTNMIDRVRKIAGVDTIDYCIEKNQSKKDLSYELKNLLLAA